MSEKDERTPAEITRDVLNGLLSSPRINLRPAEVTKRITPQLKKAGATALDFQRFRRVLHRALGTNISSNGRKK